MIPKIIHYVWLGGEMPQKYQQYIDGWRTLMPDYTFMLWNESNFDISVSRYATEANAYNKPGFVSDYIRVSVLEEYGGIYLDTDVEVLKPFDDLLDNEFFIGFENDANVGTAIIGSEPHHNFISGMKEFYLTQPFLKNGKPNMKMMPSTSYFTYFLHRDYGLKLKSVCQNLCDSQGSKIAIYSEDYFSPLNFNSNKETITSNTYAVHRFANSWSSNSARRVQKFVNGVRKLVGKRIFASFSRLFIKVCFKMIKRDLKKQAKHKNSCNI